MRLWDQSPSVWRYNGTPMEILHLLALLPLFPLLFFFDPFLILVLNPSASSCCKNKILPRHEKTGFLHMYAKTKAQISCAVNAQLISAFVFAIQMVQSLFFLNPKFQASFYPLWLYSPVCVRSVRKPQRQVFS